MYSTIVVPLDGSAFGERALPTAVTLGRRSDATLDLVHVHEPLVPASGAPTLDTRFESDTERQQLERAIHLADLLTLQDGIKAKATCLHGEVAAALQAYIAERGADLVVMTTHGRGGLSRAWLGSVADELARHSPVPLLLIRPDAECAPGSREPLFRQILVPLDGSPRSEDVLTHAASLGTPGDTEYHLLTVVAPGTESGLLPDLIAVRSRDLAGQLAEERARAEANLARLAESLREIGAHVETHTTVHGQAAIAILDFIRERAIDLVVLSTHVRSVSERFRMGSIADKVLRGAEVPVLLCGPQLDLAGARHEGLSSASSVARPSAAE